MRLRRARHLQEVRDLQRCVTKRVSVRACEGGREANPQQRQDGGLFGVRSSEIKD